ncbi:MAG: GNAT family N-acetyltransferase [Bacteroidota bacterium]
MHYHIRPATESDFPALVKLFQEFAHFEKRPEKMTNTVERMQKEKDLFNAFVVENKEEKIIGYVTYFFTYHTWTGKCLYMDDLYVTPAYRGKNIGSGLLDKVIEFGKRENCHQLRWKVSKWNSEAIGFYKKIGALVDDVENDCMFNLT